MLLNIFIGFVLFFVTNAVWCQFAKIINHPLRSVLNEMTYLPLLGIERSSIHHRRSDVLLVLNFDGGLTLYVGAIDRSLKPEIALEGGAIIDVPRHLRRLAYRVATKRFADQALENVTEQITDRVARRMTETR